MNIMISVSQIYCRMLNSDSDSWKYFGAFKFVKLISFLLVTFFRFCLLLFAVDFVFIAALAANFWFFVFFFLYLLLFFILWSLNFIFVVARFIFHRQNVNIPSVVLFLLLVWLASEIHRLWHCQRY